MTDRSDLTGGKEERRVSDNAGSSLLTPDNRRRGEQRLPLSSNLKKESFYEAYGHLIEIDLTNLDKSLLKASHVKLGVLKAHNYHVWANTHKRFFKGRGMWSIVDGSRSMPPAGTPEAKNYFIVD